MSTAELRLFELLDKSGAAGPGVVPLAALQEACVEVPYVSSRLCGRRRYQLYRCLLLDTPTLPAAPQTFSEHAAGAGDVEKGIAGRLGEVMGDDAMLTEAELQGFVCMFSAATGCHFDEEMTGITLALATVIAAADLPPGPQKLSCLYELLDALRKDFVIPAASRAFEGSLLPLLRLLLQYHDPQLSRHLDQRAVNIGAFFLDWVRRLFVMKNNNHNHNHNFQEALCLWDWLLIVGDPTMTVYFALSYFIAHRQRFLSMETNEELTNGLMSVNFVLPACKEEAVDPGLHDGRPVSFLSLRSGKSLAQNADIAYRNTPHSTRRVIDALLFSDEGFANKSPEALEKYYTAYTALPLERSDFAESFATQTSSSSSSAPVNSAALNYVLLDCRSRKSFDFARLPSAVHIGDDIGFDNEKLDNVVVSLRDIKGTHFCIFGTGRPINEEFNLLKVMSLHLMQCGFPYVSIGGFRGIIPLIKAKTITVVHTSIDELTRNEITNTLEALKKNLMERLPHVEIDKEVARQKAEELGTKARDKVLAAKSWGLSIMQRVGNRFSSNSSSPPTTNLPTTTSANNTVSSNNNNNNNSNSNSNNNNNGGGLSLQTRQTSPTKHVFSLGVDDADDRDGDDFDLITSVPVYSGTAVARHDGERIVKGTLVSAEASSSPSPPPQPPLENTAAASKGILAEIDEEFDRLFGDAESPTGRAFEATGPSTEVLEKMDTAANTSK